MIIRVNGYKIYKIYKISFIDFEKQFMNKNIINKFRLFIINIVIIWNLFLLL